MGQSDTENPNSQLYTQTGSLIITAVPFVEAITSYANEKIHEANQKEWNEFVEDADNMLNKYHELQGILERGKFGEVSRQITKQLEEELNSFSKSYGEDKNETI